MWTPRERVVIARMENIWRDCQEKQMEVKELEHAAPWHGDDEVNINILADYARDGGGCSKLVLIDSHLGLGEDQSKRHGG